jgi:hypothetical protein
MNAQAARRRVRQRAVVVAGAVLLCLANAAAAPAAPPTYGAWSTPVWLGPVVNSTGLDAGPALSWDGLSLYFYTATRPGFGGNDIWVSQRPTVNDAWGAPVNLGPTINTAAAEFVPAFTPDGHWMYFGSDRPGGSGLQDIWRSYRADIDDDFAWQAPTNLGPAFNSAADDNASTYFENGGHPQLIFGSGRLGGAARDLFVSNLQVDGTWGPATLIPELSSPGTENRPGIRQDGLEIFFYSDRAGGQGNDLWTATRATVDAPWSTPVNLGPTVNSAAGDQHSYPSLDGRALVFSSGRPGGLGSFDLYVTTRNAELTVTATNQSRLFGQPNPPLTYAITGFVGGETSAVVSGTAACTTTATPSSPGGSYPITCAAGTLTAPGYSFATFVAGTLTVAYTKPCLAGTNAGPLRVAAGEALCIGAGGYQTGPVTVGPGGSLDVEGGRITGPVVASGAAVVRICGATITGPLTITGSTGPVVVGGEGCGPNTITGPVRLTGNTGGVVVSGNTVVGPLRVTGNAAPVHAAGNSVTGPVTSQP